MGKMTDKEFRAHMIRAASTPTMRFKDAFVLFVAKVGGIVMLILILTHLDAIAEFLYNLGH
jgi:hypothetical protein